MSAAVEVHASIEPLREEWEELATRVGASPFERPGWFSSWLDAFGARELSVLASRREGRLAAVMPVAKRGGTVCSITNWHTPVYGPVAEDEEAASALFEHLLQDRPRRVDLAFLAPSLVDLMREASGARRFTQRVVLRSPYVETEQGWEEYWQGLSSNHRSNVRRRRRRLAEMGEVEVEVLEGGAGIDALLEEAFRLEASGWKGEKGTAILSSEDTRRFYEGICAWADPAGLLRLALLRLDGRMVAFNLCLEDGRRHYLLKLGQDVEFDAFAPGTILTAAMIERAFAVGLESYEFLGDAEPYKMRWAVNCHQAIRAQSFASTPTGWTDRLVQTHGRRLAKRALRRAA